VMAFSDKFSIAPSGETTDRIKKKLVWCQNWTDLLYYHAKYGEDRGSRARCRRKSVMFFCLSVFLSCFVMTKFVITETIWSSIIFKTIMVSLHRGRFVVVHLCSSFPIDPQNFFPGANFYQKLPFLVPYGHSFIATTLKFRTTVRSWSSLPQAKFCKKSRFGENVYYKLAILAIFWAVSPHLLNQNGKIWREGAKLGDPLPCQIFEKSLKGIYPFGEYLYQKLPILAILVAVSLHLQSDNGEIWREGTDLDTLPRS